MTPLDKDIPQADQFRIFKNLLCGPFWMVILFADLVFEFTNGVSIVFELFGHKIGLYGPTITFLISFAGACAASIIFEK